MMSRGFSASVSYGDFNFFINASRATVRDFLIAGSVVTVSLGGIFALFKYVTREEPRIVNAVNEGLGGERDDQQMGGIEPGSLHVLLHCFTNERFLEVLEEFKSGIIKERLEKEFLNIGIETEGLVVEIENIKEVEEKATAIKNKIKNESQEQENRTPKNISKEQEPTLPQIIVQAGAYGQRMLGNITEELHMELVKNSAREAYDILKDGGTAVDAVEAAVRVLENSEYFNAGYGSLLTEDGEVECDAMIMDGETLNTGAVISGRHFRNPVSLAKLIMNDTIHCALSGEGALKYAENKGFPTCEPTQLVTQHARDLQIPHSECSDSIFRHFADRAKDSSRSDATSAVSKESGRDEGSPGARKTGRYPSGDTVSAVARDIHGRLACAVSTGGITGKLTGRVSDASMVGCGGYANKHGAATTSGLGESLMKMTLAREVVYMMESGMNAQASAESALHKMRNQFECPSAVGGVVAIDKEGNFGKAFTTDMMGWASIKGDKTDCGLDDRMEI